MNQARVGLLVAAALLAVPLTVAAQPKGGKGPKGGQQQHAQPKAGGKGTDAEPINMDEPDKGAAAAAPAGPDAATTPVEGAGEPEGEATNPICAIEPEICKPIDTDKAAARALKAQMYAVQQIYALRYHRFEVNPFWGITMNDQFVAHPGPGLALNYYLTNVLAIGVSGNLYAGLNSNSSFNFETSRSARVGEPVTEYQWNANLNFEYVPAYGKFAGFSDFIFHYDFYVLGGVGAISTRPIAVIDPDNRTFDWKPKISFHLGGGLRIFLNRWLAATLEVSDYIFFDELENPSIADGIGANGKPKAQDKSTWLAKDSAFTNNVQAQLGISVFLPFTWEYRLPK